MDCNTCKEHHKQAEPVSFAVFESMKATLERANKRLWVVVITLLVAISVMTYLYVDAITQYETYEIEQEVDTGDGDAYIAGVGDVYYGQNPTDSTGQTP